MPIVKKKRNKKNKNVFWKLAGGFVLLIVAIGVGVVAMSFLSMKISRDGIFIEGVRSGMVKVFPVNVEGDWKNIENSLEAPDVDANGGLNYFSDSNSATYDGGLRSVSFSDFSLTGDDLEHEIEQQPDNESFDYSEEAVEQSGGNGVDDNSGNDEKEATEKNGTEDEVPEPEEEINPSDEQGAEKINEEQDVSAWTDLLGGKTALAAQVLNLEEIEKNNFLGAEIGLSFGAGEQDNYSKKSKSLFEKLKELSIRRAKASDNDFSGAGLDTAVIVKYSVDGENWESIDFFSEEISNRTNKGYFNYDASLIKSWEDLKNLKIKVEGLIEEETTLTSFLDSVWVEVKYEADNGEEREMFSDKKGWRKDEHPKFKIEDPEMHDSLLEKTRDKIVAVFQEDSNLTVKLKAANGKEFELEKDRDFKIRNEGSIEVELLPKQDLPPGNYTLDILLDEDGGQQSFEGKFTWGLLAVNVNKSIYLENEVAHVQLAALNVTGHTLCDANLKVEIESSDMNNKIFQTKDGTIKKSDTCGANNVTDIADYFFHYETGGKGIYSITFINIDEGFEITDSFEVKKEVEFEVERVGATRINPFEAAYEMTFNIRANEDFKGSIIETVPINFKIEPDDSFSFSEGNDIQYITWENVEIKKGMEISLSYVYQAPEESPRLYLTGPLQLDSLKRSFSDWLVISDKPTFKEARQWQIASDTEEASGLSIMLNKKGKPIKFDYTDDNNNENLIIKTDEKTYIGLTRADVYFSVTNTNDKPELVNLQAHFPEDIGEVKKIEKLTESVPYEIDVPDYGPKAFICEERWQEIADGEFKEDLSQYQCQATEEIRGCDSLSEDGKSCTLDNVQIGSHKEIKNKDEWQDMSLSNDSLQIEKGFFDKLARKEIRRKPIPQNFKVLKSTHKGNRDASGSLIGPGETRYYKMEITFPPNSSGEFYLEAIGDKEGYGLLDPWWNSSWGYRKSITIDHDRVGIISDLSSNASSGQNQVVVDDGSLFAASETVVIKDDSNEETGTISSVSSNTLTMQSNLSNSYTTASNAFVKNTTDSVNLSNFPMLVNLASDTDLGADAQGDGDDIVFTASDEITQLDHEIEDFNGTTGELQAWVEVPTLSTGSDTVVYMYYGNATCGNQENVSGVWDSNYKMVQHLDDLTTSTTEDSISSSNNMTKRAANEPIETSSGQIGRAQSFDGTNDYDKTTNNFIVSPTSLTISSWIKKESGGSNYETALHKASGTTIGSSDYWLGVDISDYLTATIGANQSGIGWAAGQTTTTATYGQWYYLTASWDGSVVKVYIDGVYNKQYNLTSYGNLTTPTRLGASSDGANYQFRGVVDEARISDSSRGPDWIKTVYNNQSSSSFYTLGSEVAQPNVPILQQMHYHWRNDDGSESGATSATSGTEDTTLALDEATRKRLRIEISNEGIAASTNTTYRLEYGEKSTTCGDISTWTDVGAASGDWDMSDSSNLTDGNNTTNIANNIGGVTDENTTFETPNAAIKDTSSQTATISLATTEYMEAEYSIIANSSAIGKNYCFRLTNAGSTTDFIYSTYAEASIPKLEQIHYRWRNDDGGEGDTTSWYNGSWSYRKKITVDHTKVEDDHTDFPILVHLDSAETNFWSHCTSKAEIVFTQSNGTTKLKREVETFDHTADDLYVWVKIPTMDKDDDLDIYLYYGNGSASETDDADTWDSNYKMVQHLDDLTTSTTEDSISSSNNMTKRAANEPIETSSGQIGRAQSFDGTNDYDKTTNNFIVSPTSLTISSWIKKESGGSNYETALHKASTNTIGSSDYWLGVDTNDYLTATIGANTGVGWAAGQTTTTATYGQWYYLTASWDGSVVKVYIDGTYNKQYNLTSYGNLTTPTRLGAANDGTTYQFKGVVDEVRISDSSRGADWIKTSYNNQDSPSDFYSVDGEQVGAGATWKENQDTLTSVDKNTLIRSRFEVSNEGNSTLSNTTYRIEYGAKSTTCAAISAWTALPNNDTQHWRMADSTNLTEGGGTTNVTNGLTDENTAFVAGQTKDTNNQTAGITLTPTQFTEIEHSIKATSSATNGTTYCFRLTNAGSTNNFTYTRYSEATIAVAGIAISGTVYLANETMQATTGNGGQCDSSTSNLSLRVNGGTASTTTCSSSDGSFTFTGVLASAGDTITIYSTDSTDKSNRVYVSDGTTDTGMNLYKDTIAIGDEQDGSLNILDTTDYDNDQNSGDMLYDAEDSTTDTFIGESGIELHIHTGDTFAPNGNVTTAGAEGHLHIDDSGTFTGSSGEDHAFGGDVLIDASATLTAPGTEDDGTIKAGGSWTNTATGTFTAGSGKIIFTATSGTEAIDSQGDAFYDLTIGESSGTATWNLSSALDVNGDLVVDYGTLGQGDNAIDLEGDLTIGGSGVVTAHASANFQVGGSWSNSGTFTHSSGTVTFDSTDGGETIDDGGSAFNNIIFNGSGGDWIYTDGSSTAPGQTTVQNGTPTFLNTKTGTLSVTGGTFNQDWYLGVHVVNAAQTTTNIDTGDSDITISEIGSNTTVWKHSGADWGSAAALQTTGTAGTGINPQPNNSDAIRLREFSMTASASCPGAGCTLYRYNLQVDWVGSYGEYDYYDDYGENYLTSCLANTSSCSDDSTDDDTIGVGWYRGTIGTINTPYDTVNDPPTQGSWYAGMLEAISFTIDSFSKDFGVLTPGANPSDLTNTLTVTTSATHGYVIYTRAEQDMTCSNNNLCGTAAISDWPSSNSSPTTWSGGSFGFGYTTNDYSLQGGTADRFSGPDFSGFIETGFGDPVADRAGPSSAQENIVTYRIAAEGVQTAGTYQTGIIYVAVPMY